MVIIVNLSSYDLIEDITLDLNSALPDFVLNILLSRGGLGK